MMDLRGLLDTLGFSLSLAVIGGSLVFLYYIFVEVGITTFIDYIFNRKEYKNIGSIGERYTYRILKSNYPQKQIFRNLYILQSNGKYTEIDLVSVGRGAIIVYESKNYSGWIFGDEYSQYWTQSFHKNRKQRFYNPVMQNNTHIDALKNYLGNYPLEYHSIIVFSVRCELKGIKCDTPNTYIIKRNLLDRTVSRIRKKADFTMTEQQLNEVIELLSKVQRPSEEIKAQHLEDVKNSLATCPKCGGELVKRAARATGNKFMGCSNFPKCRFTREITQ